MKITFKLILKLLMINVNHITESTKIMKLIINLILTYKKFKKILMINLLIIKNKIL
jgi:hypothetical protein